MNSDQKYNKICEIHREFVEKYFFTEHPTLKQRFNMGIADGMMTRATHRYSIQKNDEQDDCITGLQDLLNSSF